MLLLFLPPLLYWEALTTSWRELRANLRVVVLTSVALVLATAGVVAVLGHVLGLPWAVAWVLGAVVAPTDATAVGAMATGLPRRQLTTLRAESLVNEGTALVLFSVALSVATGERSFSWVGTLDLFGLSYLGGALAGLLVAWLAMRFRRLTADRLLENGADVLTPFAAFLFAEVVGASGVLAAVVAGLATARVGPRVIGARTRMQARGFWRITSFLLNGALFVLVGLQDDVAGSDAPDRSGGDHSTPAVGRVEREDHERCGQRCSPTSAQRSSPCAMPAPSTTPSCAACRPRSTARRYGLPPPAIPSERFAAEMVTDVLRAVGTLPPR